MEESNVPLLICENEGLDTTTPRGKNIFGKLVLDAELEADLASTRVKAALVVARRRGKKLGTHNPKVKGKGAKAMKNKALNLARLLINVTKPLKKRGYGARRVQTKLNETPKAVQANGGIFYLSKVQRVLANQMKLKLL